MAADVLREAGVYKLFVPVFLPISDLLNFEIFKRFLRLVGGSQGVGVAALQQMNKRLGPIL